MDAKRARLRSREAGGCCSGGAAAPTPSACAKPRAGASRQRQLLSPSRGPSGECRPLPGHQGASPALVSFPAPQPKPGVPVRAKSAGAGSWPIEPRIGYPRTRTDRFAWRIHPLRLADANEPLDDPIRGLARGVVEPEPAWELARPTERSRLDVRDVDPDRPPCRPPDGGPSRRHHHHPTVLQRAVRQAARPAELTKRVTCHTPSRQALHAAVFQREDHHHKTGGLRDRGRRVVGLRQQIDPGGCE